MDKIKVKIWNEYRHEVRSARIRAVYPDGIHGAISEMLGATGRFDLRTATLDMPEHGLTEDVLADTDVLIWWGHTAHAEVADAVVDRVVGHILNGMGAIFLHSGHESKPFKRLMGTSCALKWRENDERERIWVVDPAHPIARGLPEYIELPAEETYGERFDIPAPDELVFVSWFSGGEVFRSGCCFRRGRGRIFYFRPGHEEYPTFYRADITRVIENAIDWARPAQGPNPHFGHVPEPYENIARKEH
jgi:trehalose utilization protein